MNKLKDIAFRAALAYFDTVLGLLLAGALTDLNISVIKTVLVAAAAPALSIIRNGLQQMGAPVPSTLPKPDPKG